MTITFTAPHGVLTGSGTQDGDNAISLTFTQTTTSTITINGSATPSVAHGAAMTIAVAGGPGNPTDWVGIYPSGTSPSSNSWSPTSHNWAYLNDSVTPPSPGLTSATLTTWIVAPATAGSYTLGLFVSNTYSSIVTIPVTVT